MNWDGILSFLILALIILVGWSRYKEQTIKETIQGIKEQVEKNG
tara:strand:+ start:320 stop:451 length:132 start_codon:yes stop_codon:yes gene_type:complete